MQPNLFETVGITQSTAHLKFGDGWTLESRPLDAGPTWEDRLARRDDIIREEGRVRIYLVSQASLELARQSIDRAARREYQVPVAGGGAAAHPSRRRGEPRPGHHRCRPAASGPVPLPRAGRAEA
jgi:hypothetical protein